ncbi:ankyrin repeat domain-containing protein SOWAHB [Hyalella azteca]|uniref:Ankyrin repeat domain-containing protein SOWAHB n=1 Tax=Hyalella azteca TaxID=294128 RepID=A0A8B7NPC4_HYAAZ|nr:ankyrin repeat domain-containing protein SOWAHB [Hyalella azteca]
MANGATEFSLDAVRDFMLCRGGRVTNHELVQHFKSFLTNTDNKELARDQFKQYVNTLSHVVKEENNKYLVLKKKYCVDAPLTSSNNRPSDPHVLQSPDSNFIPAQYSQNHAPHNVSIPNEFAVSPQAAASSGRGYLFHDRGPEMPGEQMSKMTDFNQRYGSQQSQGIQQNDAASPYGQQFQRRDSNSSFGGAVPNQDYSAPPLPPRQIASPYNGGAPPAARLRTPPPYRPPPPPPESPKIMDPSLMHNPHGNPNFGPSYNSHEYNRFPAPGAIGHPSGLSHQISAHEYRSPDPYPKEHHRRSSYEAHSEQDFRNHNRSSSFDEPPDLGIPVPQSFPASSQHQQSNQGLIPLSATKRTGPRQAPSHPDGILQSRSRKNKYDSPPSDASQASSDDSSELRAADRGRSHNQVDRNKENFEPPTHSIAMQSKQDMPNNPDGDAESLAPPTTGGNEKKISVKEKTQIFNRMASETNLGDKLLKNGSKSNRSSRAEKDYDDTKSILSYGQDGQDWLVAAASSDFNEILRLLKAHPELIRRKDRHNGYTALHWAAKHGRAEVVRLLAGTYQADPNARSNGGYTPLHLAAHYNRQDVFDLLVHYGSDLNLRDYSGKKPRQYNTIASSTISPEHQKRIVQRRNSMERRINKRNSKKQLKIASTILLSK